MSATLVHHRVSGGFRKLYFGVSALVLALLVSCGTADYRNEDNFADLLEMEFPDTEPSNADIARVREDIRKVSQQVREMIAQEGRLASFWNALGEEYRRLSMYQPALRAYQKSLEIQPMNHIVQYKAGIMAGQLYAIEVDTALRDEWLRVAEKHYRNALIKAPEHTDSLYALAVLLFFEKKDGPGAQEMVDRLLVKDPRDVRSLFLAGRIAAESGRPDAAARYYETILTVSTDENEKEQARNNLEVLRAR